MFRFADKQWRVLFWKVITGIYCFIMVRLTRADFLNSRLGRRRMDSLRKILTWLTIDPRARCVSLHSKSIETNRTERLREKPSGEKETNYQLISATLASISWTLWFLCAHLSWRLVAPERDSTPGVWSDFLPEDERPTRRLTRVWRKVELIQGPEHHTLKLLAHTWFDLSSSL